MNWLIYIAGWFIGWGIFNALYKGVDTNAFTIVKVVVWTMAWIWFCWRFIP